MKNLSGSSYVACVGIIAFLFLLPSCISAQNIPLSKPISPDLFGLFFEDINYAADGGLYAELVQNRSFEYIPTEQKGWNPFSFWEYTSTDFSYGTISVETSDPVHPNNPHYMVLTIEHLYEKGGVGMKNTGFDGMAIKAGETYNFSVFMHQLSKEAVTLRVSLQSTKGEILAEGSFSTDSDQWKKYSTSLTASASNDSASLVMLAITKGKIAFDMVSLFPEKTFKNRPNGLRADLAQMLADMKPAFIRFPGGCLVHGDGVNNMYRWENTIGPLEQRKEQRNIWGYHQTAGLGFYEYFRFCEDIGAKPLPVLPAAVSCQNSGGTWRIGGTGQQALPADEMKDYLEEVLHLIEWANGPESSEWGSKRAAAGHPEPFNLEYIGIGNEDKMTPEFTERFTMIYRALYKKHPEIKVIGSAGPFYEGEDFDKGWNLARELKFPIIDEHYYTNPRWLLSNQCRYDAYDRKACQVYLGEYASWGNKMINAVAEAAYMTALERNGDVVRMASYAPMLAKKGFTQWKTDMIFFDNVQICPTPNYYVQKLFSLNRGDIYYGNIIQVPVTDTLRAASCVRDSQSGDIILKLVNADNDPRIMKVNLSRFKNIDFRAILTVLSGKKESENTFENPDNVIPVTTDLNISKIFDYSAPAMSLSVIRIKIIK